jgi:hypothetical protein
MTSCCGPLEDTAHIANDSGKQREVMRGNIPGPIDRANIMRAQQQIQRQLNKGFQAATGAVLVDESSWEVR